MVQPTSNLSPPGLPEAFVTWLFVLKLTPAISVKHRQHARAFDGYLTRLL
jgi:hypothetical protein